jgi:peroxiredoxin
VAAGVGLFGVSVDSVFSHQAFAKDLGGLPYDLIADFERTMVADYGVRRDDVPGYSGMARRSIFIVDRDRKVRWTWISSREAPLPDYDAVLEEARRVAAEAPDVQPSHDS